MEVKEEQKASIHWTYRTLCRRNKQVPMVV